MLGEIDSFVNWLRRRNQQARTWRDYAYDLHQFAQVVGDKPPGAVTFHDVDQSVMDQAARGFKPATINRRLAAISALYTFLADEDQTLVCPVLPHRHAIKERERLPRPVQADDLARFFAVVDHSRDLAMFLLMLRSGLRISEVAALRHTFANDLVSADVPVTVIQKLLGHTWLETTQNYVAANDHQVQADFYAASDKLEGWR